MLHPRFSRFASIDLTWLLSGVGVVLCEVFSAAVLLLGHFLYSAVLGLSFMV
jgi:hypothetical protein